METTWWDLIGIVFFTFMVITVGLIWALAIKASYNQEKAQKKKQQEAQNKKQEPQGQQQ